MALGRVPGRAYPGPGGIEIQDAGTPVAKTGVIDMIGAASVVLAGDKVVVTLAAASPGPPGPDGSPGPAGGPGDAGPTGPAGGTPSVAFSAYPSVTTGFTPRLAVGCGVQDDSSASNRRGFLAFCTGVGAQGCVLGGQTGYAFASHFGGGYTCNQFNSSAVTFSGGSVGGGGGRIAVVGG